MAPEKLAYYQVSDKVPSKVIRGVTSICQREDCCLSARIIMTQLGGTTSNYNKNGDMIIEDHNKFTAAVTCKSCWKGYVVNQDGELLEPLHSATFTRDIT